ncbi:hypothetical protein [Paratractidigestivibacter faecalis]|uniref:site-specific DNA-methyltransferase (adenine-specific) n=1 Tax=Paratractidigestivibacter faecalis TaxID=2292441 RepID=A0ABV1IH41_9ACTN
MEALADPNCGWFYRRDADTFRQIPGSPIAYWASETLFNAFRSLPFMQDIVPPKSGLTTGDNDLFLRCWWEPCQHEIGLAYSNRGEAKQDNISWVPCNKGGEYRKWFGNHDYVVNWKDDGEEMKAAGLKSTTFRNSEFYFHPGITWSSISSSRFHARWSPVGFIGERKGAMAFSSNKSDAACALAALNSTSVALILGILAPTLDYSEGPIGKVPIPFKAEEGPHIVNVTKRLIHIAKTDYDSSETSWDFRHSPLV